MIVARLIYRYMAAPIGTLWFGLLGYVPTLLYLGVIALITLLLLRVLHVIFREIEAGNLPAARLCGSGVPPGRHV